MRSQPTIRKRMLQSAKSTQKLERAIPMEITSFPRVRRAHQFTLKDGRHARLSIASFLSIATYQEDAAFHALPTVKDREQANITYIWRRHQDDTANGLTKLLGCP